MESEPLPDEDEGAKEDEDDDPDEANDAERTVERKDEIPAFGVEGAGGDSALVDKDKTPGEVMNAVV